MQKIDNIQKQLIKQYLHKQYAMLIIAFFIVIFIICFSFFDMEKKNIGIFAYEESEEYLHILEGNVKTTAVLDENYEQTAKFSYYAYDSNNRLVGCNRFDEPLQDLFLTNARDLKDNEVSVRFMERKGRLMQYLMVSTRQDIVNHNEFKGYILVGREISHEFRGLLRIIFIIFTGFIIYAFFIYKMTLQLVLLAVSPIYEALEAQKHFTANASHDMKTPLSIINMSLECLKRDKENKLSDFSSETIVEMEKVTKNMKNLIDTLMILAKGESVSNVNEMESLNLLSVITELISEFKKLAEHKSLKLQFECDLKKTVAYLNKTHLQLIVANILDNAIKYSENGDVIDICLCKSGNNFSFSVTDCGKGISETDLPHIFDRFYRAEESRTSEGFGLGLAIAKELADKNKIHLTVKSSLGHGSCFTLLIPEYKE